MRRSIPSGVCHLLQSKQKINAHAFLFGLNDHQQISATVPPSTVRTRSQSGGDRPRVSSWERHGCSAAVMRRRPAAVRSLGPLGVFRRINARSDSGLLMDQPSVPSAGHTGRRGPGGSRGWGRGIGGRIRRPGIRSGRPRRVSMVQICDFVLRLDNASDSAAHLAHY